MIINRIFITGITGFIGSNLAPALLAQGYKIAALYRNQVPSNTHDSWRSSVVWIASNELFTRLTEFQPDAIIHLATEYGGKDVDLAQVVETNIRLPLSILEIGSMAGCLLFINTDTFFGKDKYSYPHMPAYIQSKSQFIWWAKQHLTKVQQDCRFINMRLEHVYGPNDGSKKFTTYLFDSLIKNLPIPLTSGLQCRDFVFVDDVVAAYLQVIKKKSLLPLGLTEIEVGTGEAITLKSFVNLAKKVLNSNSILIFGALPHRQKEIMSSKADISKLRDLGWVVKTTAEEGICLSIDHRNNSMIKSK